jgi:hypothetical protein
MPTSRQKKKKKSKSASRGVSMPPMPDRRAMERVLADFVGGLGGRPKGKRTAKDEAQQLIYEAWETGGEERIELALQAIETDPDCADAYVILAEAASDIGEARDFYSQGAWGRRSVRWASGPSKKTPGISGASSKPGPTCAPGPASPNACGCLGRTTPPSAITATCSG